MNTLETLRAARKLLSKPTRWTRGHFAKPPIDDDGEYCYCAMGAIATAAGVDFKPGKSNDYRLYDLLSGILAPRDDADRAYIQALEALANVVNAPTYLVWQWNDTTVYDDVMSKFSAACEAEYAKTEEAVVA